MINKTEKTALQWLINEAEIAYHENNMTIFEAIKTTIKHITNDYDTLKQLEKLNIKEV